MSMTPRDACALQSERSPALAPARPRSTQVNPGEPTCAARLTHRGGAAIVPKMKQGVGAAGGSIGAWQRSTG